MCESYGDSSHQPLQVVPAAPAPSIPPGLKHRFPRFTHTSSTQTFVVKTEADGRFPDESKEDEQEGRRKKKRKKEKRMKLEPEETDILRMNENVAEIQDDILEETKKKKKKKVEQEEMEPELVKSEPMDSWNSGFKKKKKKKKNYTDD